MVKNHHRIRTKSLEIPQEVCFLSRSEAVQVLGISPATFSRALEILNAVNPKGYTHSPRNRGFWVPTLEVIHQYLQLVAALGTTEQAIIHVQEHMENFWYERTTEEGN
jgi:hypothetical protein